VQLPINVYLQQAARKQQQQQQQRKTKDVDFKSCCLLWG